MKTVFKYSLDLDALDGNSDCVVRMKEQAELLCVQVQHGKPCVWARVDSQANPNARRRIRVVGTGHPAPAQVYYGVHQLTGTYIDTVQLQGGDLVLHFFDMGEAK